MVDSSPSRIEEYELVADEYHPANSVEIPNTYRRSGKRLLDLFLAIILIVLLTPLALVIALLIYVSNGTPVVFRQDRFGIHGTTFKLQKFRTMIPSSSTASTITVAGDSRVTALGKVLRSLKLDELPQLWHVLNGEMSFVGPRPDMPDYIARIPTQFRTILKLRPGITGVATIAFRNEEYLLSCSEDPVTFNDTIMFPLKQCINMDYLHKISPMMDIKCVVATIIPSLAPKLGFKVFNTPEEVHAEFGRYFKLNFE